MKNWKKSKEWQPLKAEYDKQIKSSKRERQNEEKSDTAYIYDSDHGA